MRYLQPFQHKLYSTDDRVGVLHYLAVIRGYVRLALSAVYQQILYIYLCAVVSKLDMRGNSRAAKSYRAAFSHCPEEILAALYLRRLDVGTYFHTVVRFYGDGLAQTSPDIHHVLDLSDFTADRSMYRRRHERAGITYLLPDEHLIPDFHQRLARCADMLRHADGYFLGNRHLSGQLLCRITEMRQMYRMQL